MALIELSRPKNTDARCVTQTLVICEVRALVRYATERGLDREGILIAPLNDALIALEAREHSERLSTSEGGQPSGLEGETAAQLRTRVLVLYAKLNALTLPVSGRSLLETEEHFGPTVRPLHVAALGILFIVLTNEVLELWWADLLGADTGWLPIATDARRYIFDIWTPFLWGALGSMVYILKRLNDLAEERLFDRSSSRGWITRILLGAILGGAVQYIYDPKLFSEEGFKLGASAIGFLTGVGVKVVYGAIEKTVQTLADKMNLDSVKRDDTDTASIKRYLSEQLIKTDQQQNPQVFAALSEMLTNLAEKK